MNEIQVVFGAGGALGAAIVRRLTAENKSVRIVVRDAERMRKLLPPSADFVTGDATDAEKVRTACRNASIIYHCVNVPYSKWGAVMPTVTDNILIGARDAKARLVFPGNVYGYGPFQTIPATEDHPLAATSKKGLLRITLERKLMEAHRLGDVRVVIPRFPDYYGPNVTNKLVAPIFEAALAGKKASWLGTLDVPHDLVYIDDAAAACLLLGATDSAYGQAWHIPGAGPITGRQFIEMIFKAAGQKPNIGVMRRGFFRFFGLFAADAREMLELLYEFERPLVLDGSKFARTFPSFKYTSHENAVRQTVEWFRRRSGQLSG
jgi:nucleoside-diphosphate-sugar epimerase